MLTITAVKVPASFEAYVRCNKETELIPALKESLKQVRKLAGKISSKQSNHAYAEGKWTLREVLQHLIDAEKVFLYRALSFARKDKTPLPPFDENLWASNSLAGNRKWDDLIEEFITVRKSALYFFESLNDEQLNEVGNASGNDMNVVGLGFVCSGHVLHHCRIIRERYLPGLKK